MPVLQGRRTNGVWKDDKFAQTENYNCLAALGTDAKSPQ
jgi:hypothetical protein